MNIPFLSKFSGTAPKPALSRIEYAASISPGHKARFGALLTGLLGELPDMLAASVIDLKSGRLLATHHLPGKLNPAKASAHNAEVLRQARQALEALGLAEEDIGDVLITLRTQWHVLRLLPGGQHFVHLMVNMRDTNLGIARSVMQTQCAASLE